MPSATQRLRFHGEGGALFGLILVNTLLSIVTLGIYSFWGKTKVREYLHGHTELAGDRFGYHGTGRELFIGAMKATGVLVLLFLTMGIVFGFWLVGVPAGDPRHLIMPLLIWTVILLLLPIAINGARRYRLSRASWRGIRFSFHGHWKAYLALLARGSLLTIITLGLHSPYFQNRRRRFLVENARFGPLGFQYDGDGKELWRAYLKSLLLTIPTLGLHWVWYRAARHRYFWSHTTVGEARFVSTVEGGQLFKLGLTNLLILIFTLGFGFAWVVVRTTRFWCENVILRGNVDWATVHQQAEGGGVVGEGLASVLDTDVGVGLGM